MKILPTVFFLLFVSSQHVFADASNLAVVKLRMREEVYNAERDMQASHLVYFLHVLDLSKTALVLIDVWEHNPLNVEIQVKPARDNIVRLLQFARANHIRIIHAASGKSIHPDCRPLPGELIVQKGKNSVMEKNFLKYLRGIDTVIYTGFQLNYCVMFNSSGILTAWHNNKNVIIVRDATSALETVETLSNRWCFFATLSMIEGQFGSSMATDDLLYASFEPKEN
ncbi:MAG: isochorismatase family protein [Candidatus Omnitrophota bacterium]